MTPIESIENTHREQENEDIENIEEEIEVPLFSKRRYEDPDDNDRFETEPGKLLNYLNLNSFSNKRRQFH